MSHTPALTLSIEQAATLLGIPATDLIDHLDAGCLPFTGEGDQRRVRFTDALIFRQLGAQDEQDLPPDGDDAP